jgi:acetaldehyde dehydrogenase/alcohol dehydrogenase
MNHPGVALILATGGSGMVQAAYSSGKPALGVGPGNVPCYIHQSANVRRAATDLMLSKTFDNGMICASEQSVIVDRAIADEFERFMTENGCVFLDESKKETAGCRHETGQAGGQSGYRRQPAASIARRAGIEVPDSTKILLVREDGVGPEHPLSLKSSAQS